jgi:hypothetical protein
MSGGLLEKAKQASGDDDVDVDAAIIETATIDESTGKPSLMLYIASGSLLLCMGLLYFMYLIPIDYFGVIVFLMLLGSGYAASLYVRNDRNGGEPVNGVQWASIAVVYLLLAGLPYVGAMDFGGSLLLNYDSNDQDGDGYGDWFDADADAITLTLRQSAGLLGSEFSGGDVSVTVSQDGSETWSGTVNVAMTSGFEGNTGTLTLAIADFYSMNAQRVKSFTGTGAPVMDNHPYTVCADVDESSDCTDLPTFELTRSVTDVDELAVGYDDGSEEDGQGGTDCEGNHESCIDYIEIQGWVGEGSPSTDSNTVPSRIRGDYQIDMTFSYEDGTATIDYATISVDGTVATWDDDLCGSGPMSIGETTTEFFFQCAGDNRFDNDDALEPGYGCYTLTVSASQGGQEVATSSSHYEYSEESGEGSGNPGEPSGTYYWEEFNPVSSC